MKLILILTGLFTSKIVSFGAQKTWKHTLKSRRTQNESQFSADFGSEALFFFENEQGEAVTVNGDRYWSMLNEILFTKIEEQDIGNTAEATLDVLRPIFEDRIISRRAYVVWPPRSCDLAIVGVLFVGCRQR